MNGREVYLPIMMLKSLLTEGNSMKKTALVALLAAVFVLATAASAFAAIAPTYVPWTAGGANAGSADTPHADYQLHTEKCAVCHSVHNAPATVPVGATGETELLLRSSAADACTYCHIDSNIGGKVVYDGVASNYRTDYASNHYGGPASCTNCHSVHSANTIEGLVESKILRDGQFANGANYFYEDAYLDDLYGAGWTEADVDADPDRDVQISVFCTKCHDNWSDAAETTISAYGYDGVGYSYVDVKHHPMKAADVIFLAQGASTTTQVAWVDANYCRSCHDAGYINQPAGTITQSFPHYTPGYAKFLQVFTDAASNTGSGTIGAPGADTGSDDGACIKCHIRGAGGQGAGLSY